MKKINAIWIFFLFLFIFILLKLKVFQNSSKRQLARIFFINSTRKDSIRLRYAHERGKGVRQLNAAIFVVCKRSVDFGKISAWSFWRIVRLWQVLHHESVTEFYIIIKSELFAKRATKCCDCKRGCRCSCSSCRGKCCNCKWNTA